MDLLALTSVLLTAFAHVPQSWEARRELTSGFGGREILRRATTWLITLGHSTLLHTCYLQKRLEWVSL